MLGNHSSFASKPWRLALMVLLSFAISACGGGGGGGDSPTSISVAPKSISLTTTRQAGALPTLVTVNFKGAGVVVGFPPGVSPPSWLGIVQSGAATANSVVFSVAADVSSLPAGNHSTTVRFITGLVPAGGGLEDATDVVYADIPVNLKLLALDVTPSAFNLAIPNGATAPSTGTFALAIETGRHWIASSNQPWLTVGEASGNGPRNLGYSVNPAILGMGAHSGTISVTDDDGRTVTVIINVTVSAPRLTVSPANFTINVGADTSAAALSRTLTISDQLGGASAAHKATWSMAPIDAAWLRMTPASGSTAPAVSGTVSVYAPALASMANGTYTGTIKLNYTTEDAQSYSVSVPVTLNLNSPLISIAVTPANVQNAVGQGPALQYTATGSYKAGYSQNMTSQVTWTSSSPAFAAVSNVSGAAGSVQPLLPGTTTIKAEAVAAGVSGSTPLKVVAPAAVAYVVQGGGNISQFIVNADGSLTPMMKKSVPGGPRPAQLVFTPDGKYAYGLNEDFVSTGQYGLSQFSVDECGSLTPLSPAVVKLSSYFPQEVAVDAAGKRVYVATQADGSGAVARLDIGAGGTLTLDSKPPVVVGSGVIAYGVGLSPTAPYLYVPDLESTKVYQFGIAADGSVSALTPLSVTAGSHPRQVIVHPSGLYAYVVNFTNNVSSAQPPGFVSQYNIGAGGQLIPMATPKVDAGASLGRMYMAPSGQSAYLVHTGAFGSNTLFLTTYRVSATGGLVPNYSYATAYAGFPAMDPDEKYLYVPTAFNTILRYAVGADGTLVQSDDVVTLEDADYIFVRKPRG